MGKFSEKELLRYGEPHIDKEFPWGAYRVADVQGPVRMFIEVHSGDLKMFSNRRALRKPAGNEYFHEAEISPQEAENRAWVYLERTAERVPDNLGIKSMY